MNTLSPSTGPVTVSVAPTSTVVLEVDTRYISNLSVQITNIDSTQVFAGTVQRRTWDETSWATSNIPDFATVSPGSSIMADLDVRGTAMLRIVGTMDGAGGNVQVSYTRRGES
jgi:hypothetical protein